MYLIVERKINENGSDYMNYIGVFEQKEEAEKWLHNTSIEKGREYIIDETSNVLVCRNVDLKKVLVYSIKRVPKMSY